MNTTALKTLKVLGHAPVKNARCRARHAESAPSSSGRPASPPVFCCLPEGHEGPHMHRYATKATVMRDDLTVIGPELPDLCEKCKTKWPCSDAKKVITAFKEEGQAND